MQYAWMCASMRPGISVQLLTVTRAVSVGDRLCRVLLDQPVGDTNIHALGAVGVGAIEEAC
jgi:hypothetical protein